MRTLTFSNNPCYLKKMVYHRDIPSATTRLPGGVVSGFTASSRITGSCYVIEEEQSSDGQVDDNGNNQRSELDTSCSSTGVDKAVNFTEHGIDNIEAHSDNSNNNNHPAGLSHSNASINKVNSLPSSTHLSSSQFLLSNKSITEVNSWSQPVSKKTLFNDARQHATSPHMAEVKSGHLVLIIPEQKVNLVNPKSECSFLSSSRTLPRRCPVIVKIHDRGYEKYVIISSTKRQLALSPFCLKLKHSYVTQSATNPSCFSLVIDSSEGKTFTFEASSPNVAREWMQSLTLTDSSLHWSNPAHCLPEAPTEASVHTQHLTTNSKSSLNTLNLSNLAMMPALSESVEEDEE